MHQSRIKLTHPLAVLLGACLALACSSQSAGPAGTQEPKALSTQTDERSIDSLSRDSTKTEPSQMTTPPSSPHAVETATLGAGCFWCTEAVYEQVEGVLSATSGYMGGSLENPTYKDVCRGDSGHAEVVQLEFDPSVVTYEEILSWFWRLHDPTTLNRQGADVGTQYRSVIFTHSEEQARIAAASKQAADQSGVFKDPIVTEITPATTFYPAEDYHQEYYSLNRQQGYCRAVIAPKLGKLGLKE